MISIMKKNGIINLYWNNKSLLGADPGFVHFPGQVNVDLRFKVINIYARPFVLIGIFDFPDWMNTHFKISPRKKKPQNKKYPQ